MMSPCITASSAGSCIIKDPLGQRRTALFIGGATTQRIYDVDEDGWTETQSLALAGAFGAGTCGAWGLWSNTITANGGTTTTVTFTQRIGKGILGKTIWFQSGANAGYRVTVTNANISVTGGNTILTFESALPNSVQSGDTFKINSGTYYVFNAYSTLASGVFKSYDSIADVVTTLSNTNLPASWGTDGRLVATPSYAGPYATGTATGATANSLTNSSKTWTTNQWTNSQIRITAGTGVGQVRTISSNTATAITVSTNWTITPDTSSIYAIEANDDFLYLLGNNDVAMYKYTISTNTWALITPAVARSLAAAAGMTANVILKSGNSTWANENNIQDGRYIYSFRGNATGTLHRYDIALNTWTLMTYVRGGVTFTTGSSGDVDGSRIYLRKDATNRYYYYDVINNEMIPFVTDFYPEGTAVVGDKIFTATYENGSGDNISFLYAQGNTGTAFRRVMLY